MPIEVAPDSLVYPLEPPYHPDLAREFAADVPVAVELLFSKLEVLKKFKNF